MKQVVDYKEFPRRDGGCYLLILFYLDRGEWKLWPEAWKDGDGPSLEMAKIAVIRANPGVTATRVKVIRLPRLQCQLPADTISTDGVETE
jgi:hypothetical protein